MSDTKNSNIKPNNSTGLSSSEARSVIDAALEEVNEGALFIDDLDSAIVGVGCQYTKNAVIVYSEERILEALVFEQGMTYEDAQEYYSFNIAGAWVGENTPIIMKTVDEVVRDWSGR
jgi:hypothetical protein